LSPFHHFYIIFIDKGFYLKPTDPSAAQLISLRFESFRPKQPKAVPNRLLGKIPYLVRMKIFENSAGKKIKIFAREVEKEALEQIKDLAECRAYKNEKIRIMARCPRRKRLCDRYYHDHHRQADTQSGRCRHRLWGHGSQNQKPVFGPYTNWTT